MRIPFREACQDIAENQDHFFLPKRMPALQCLLCALQKASGIIGKAEAEGSLCEIVHNCRNRDNQVYLSHERCQTVRK